MGKHFEETRKEKRKKAKRMAKEGKRVKHEQVKQNTHIEKELEELALEINKEVNLKEYKKPNISNSSTAYLRGEKAKTHQTSKKQSNAKQKRKTKKRTGSNFLLGFLALICIGMLVYSGIHIFGWFKDNGGIEEEVEQALNQVEIQEVEDDENVKIVESKEEKTSPYWEYIKMNLMDVDFSELEKTNNNVQGWIQVNGTNINYPFVQTTDNSYYLTHSFLKEYNEAGWVFLDYRNNIKNLDKNTIIYAHSRLDKAMFGSLKNLLQSNWYENKNNHIIKMSTKTENTLWQVFSVYHLPTTSDYLRTTFSSGSDFKQFTQMLKDRSVYDFDATINENDKILTLSTCYKTDEKMVMHAKLIKYSPK